MPVHWPTVGGLQLRCPSELDMTALEIHSRSRLAGYDPEKLAAARVTVVGLGALGQNVLQTLALSGVGEFLLIDFDSFEDHNATRSPFFPTAAELESLGNRKAR